MSSYVIKVHLLPQTLAGQDQGFEAVQKVLQSAVVEQQQQQQQQQQPKPQTRKKRKQTTAAAPAPHFWDNIVQKDEESKNQTFHQRWGNHKDISICKHFFARGDQVKGPAIKHKDQAMRVLGLGAQMTDMGVKAVNTVL